MHLTYWLISTQVDPVTKVPLDGGRVSTLTDALRLLDKAYADAGTQGGDVFRKDLMSDDGLWGVVLYKDRMLSGLDPRRADAVVAHYKLWLPPWKRKPAPAASSSKKPKRSSRPKRKRS